MPSTKSTKKPGTSSVADSSTSCRRVVILSEGVRFALWIAPRSRRIPIPCNDNCGSKRSSHAETPGAPFLASFARSGKFRRQHWQGSEGHDFSRAAKQRQRPRLQPLRETRGEKMFLWSGHSRPLLYAVRIVVGAGEFRNKFCHSANKSR